MCMCMCIYIYMYRERDIDIDIDIDMCILWPPSRTPSPPGRGVQGRKASGLEPRRRLLLLLT